MPQGVPQCCVWGATNVGFTAQQVSWKQRCEFRNKEDPDPEPQCQGAARGEGGGRQTYRMVKFGSSVSDTDACETIARLKEIHALCGVWSELSNLVAESVRKGVVPVPLPIDSHHSRENVITQDFPLLNYHLVPLETSFQIGVAVTRQRQPSKV